jgi:MFS family permease
MPVNHHRFRDESQIDAKSDTIDNPGAQPHHFSPTWILFLLSASVGVAMIGLGIIWPLIPIYAVELGATGFQVGLIIAAFNITRTFLNPFSGRLSDRWGRKPFMVLGLLLYATVSVLYVLSARVDSLILVRLLHGFTSVLVVPVALALAGDIAPPQRLGLYMGTLNMAIMLGMGTGPALGGIIRDSFGMHAAFYTMGGLALITFLAVTIFLPGDPEGKTSHGGQLAASWNRLLKHRAVQGLFLLRLFIAAGQGSVYTFLPILALRMQISSSQVGIILGVNIFVIAFLQRIFGGIADRVNPKNMVIWGTLLSGFVVPAMPYADGFYMILLLNIIMGIGNGIAMPGGFVITGQLGQTMGMGSMMGITETGWSLGMIVSPIVSGVIMDSLGVPSIFLTGGVLTIIGVLLVSFFLRGYAPSIQESSTVSDVVLHRR